MLQDTRFGFGPRCLKINHRRAFRHFLAAGLAALLFLAPLSFTASAQQSTSQSTSSKTKLPWGRQFTIYQDENGNAVCRVATLAERIERENIDTSRLGMRRINHLKGTRTDNLQTGENDSTGLTIILNGTAQLNQNPQAVAAFNRAAQNWENIIKSPITITINVDYGTTDFGQPWDAGVLGSTGTADRAFLYQPVRANMIAEATGEGNSTKQAIFNALPATTVPTDLGDAGTIHVTDPIARAIGMLPAQSAGSVAGIAFNSNFAYDFTPDDGITPGQTDFDAVATHEIGHALGFDSEAGGGLRRPTVWDLYRFRTGTTSATFPTAQRVMTIGGSPDPLQFYFVPGNTELGLSTGGPSGVTTNGGDDWQSSHWKHTDLCTGSSYIGIMDPAISKGCRRTITSNDILALSSFGYNLTNNNPPPPAPTPPPQPANDNFANAQTISGCTDSVMGLTLSATSETGEPNHDPSGSGSATHTIWYQWQAPSSGSTTITTAGSDFDTLLAVYTGSGLGSLTQLADNDDVDPGVIRTSTVMFNAIAGTTYKIAVDGWNGDSGTVKLNWTEANCSTKTDQTITFGSLITRTFGDPPFNVSATASSGLPVSFSVLSGPATISGNTVTMTGAGTVTIRASQAGDATYNAAPDVDQSFVVGKATPVITWNNPASIIFGTALSSTQLNATANTPGTFKYTPPAGIVPSVGSALLSVDFTPNDTTNYTPATKSVLLIINPANETVSFSSATYTAGEGAGNVAIVVTRTNPNTAAAVDYATSDTAGLTNCNQVTGVASSRCDYATTIGTLIFQPGEASKTFSIPIVDDGYVEGSESFTVTLSNPGAVSLGATTTATVTITDNDTAASNPIASVPFFVRQQYIDFLGREPDPTGFQGWQDILNNCAPGDTSCDRIAVSSGFFRSPEFQDRGSFLFRFYAAALGRNPTYAEFMPDLAKVSGFLNPQQLEANKAAFVNEFMTRPEYVNKYGSLSNAVFVDTLIQTSGLSSHPLRDAWVGLLNTQSATKAQVLRAFTESLEVYNKFYNQAFVVMQYFGYLRRDPDASYLQWIQTMNSNGGDFRAMISGFINSNEYVLRFGP